MLLWVTRSEEFWTWRGEKDGEISWSMGKLTGQLMRWCTGKARPGGKSSGERLQETAQRAWGSRGDFAAGFNFLII